MDKLRKTPRATKIRKPERQVVPRWDDEVVFLTFRYLGGTKLHKAFDFT